MSTIEPQSLHFTNPGFSILATDCGSTWTKTVLIEQVDGFYEIVGHGEAPTTVEKPIDDVTIGARNSIREIEELTGRVLLDKDGVITPRRPDGSGVDRYLATSSAGGGLEMLVMGVVRSMTADSARRAALGAGAVVIDAMSIDDGLSPYSRLMRMRNLRPDMILLAGGVDGGTVVHVARLIDLVAAAEPKPRLNPGAPMPVVYAGNTDAQEYAKQVLGSKTDLRLVDNLRPSLEQENLAPARDTIQILAMEHLRSQAPGYDRLANWASVPIVSTPVATGNSMQALAAIYDSQLIGVDIGGASTDVYSVLDDDRKRVSRTVSADLGLGVGAARVLSATGLDNITRWMPFVTDAQDMTTRIHNKMLRPTTISMMLLETMLEQSIAREAIRLAFEQHRQVAVGLRGVQIQREIGDIFDQTSNDKSLLDVMRVEWWVASGGIFSHAPRWAQAALVMLDGLEPEGVVRLAVDSMRMLPQLGIIASLHPEVAVEFFERGCLIRLGTAICPVGRADEGDPCIRVLLTTDDGTAASADVKFGEMRRFPFQPGQTARAVIQPVRGFDIGAGSGVKIETQVECGLLGVIVDCRGRRPLRLPVDSDVRRRKLLEWITALDAYPPEAIRRLSGVTNEV